MAKHEITLTDRQEDGLAYGIAQGSTLEGTAGAFCEAWVAQADVAAKQKDAATWQKVKDSPAVKAAVEAEVAKITVKGAVDVVGGI